jgi:type VI secretion system ImpA family protein
MKVDQVDLERLLTPISGARPAGESLRYSGLFDQVQEARREDDATLPQGVWKTSLKKADWKEVERLCLEALETRTKDLQLAAWLLEAWLRTDGAAGVVQGLSLLAGLCESFWDSVHPELEGDDPELRLAPLYWVDERLSEELRLSIPITRPETEEAPSYSLADWEAARHLENLGRANPQVLQAAEEEGRLTLPKFLVSVTLTPSAFYSGLLGELRQALEALGELGALLESRCGDRAPGFRRFNGHLVAIQRLAARVLEERQDELPAPDDGGADLPAAVWGAGGQEGSAVYDDEGLPSSGPIRSRAEAYRRLSEAADYLLRTEPHSPAPYLVKRAVSWGSLSLSELLQELLQSSSDLKTIYSLLGMKGESEQR